METESCATAFGDQVTIQPTGKGGVSRTLSDAAALLFTALGILAGVPPCAAAAAEVLNVSVTRRDLRPLPGVTLQLAGAANLQGVTDDNGRAAFPGLPPAGAVTLTPSRSGFRFEPPQFTIPELANPPAASFTAIPTVTDLALSMVSDNGTPLVGGLVNFTITLRNLGTEAATDVIVGYGSLPGLVVEDVQATQGQLQPSGAGTQWRLQQINPGASAELRVLSRATLPDAAVLAVTVVQEMDQTDTDPLSNSAQLTTQTRSAQARLSLAMVVDPSTPKAGTTLPLRLTVRNDGPNDATQIAIRSYLPAGASFAVSTNQPRLDSNVVIPRLASGAQLDLSGPLFVRFAGSFTLIANVTYFEQQLPPDAAWPEARSVLTVQPAFSRLTLLAFTDPPNPHVGDDIRVTYVARNDGPDAVTGLNLFTSEDPRLGTARFSDPNPPPPPVPGPFVFGGVLPAGAYTYLLYHYSVKAAGDLTNYFTVAYQDQPIPNAADYPELFVPIKALPADVGLSLDASPKDITAAPGDPVTLEFPVHNDGPQPARGIIVDYSPDGLAVTDVDEVIHADRVLRPSVAGYIDVADAGETVLVRKHFVAATPGAYTNFVQIKTSSERPDLLSSNVFRTQLRPGESATASFYVTPSLVGSFTGFINVQQSDQLDPNPVNDSLSFTLNVGPAPPVPPILRVRKLRTDFFTLTPIAEIEVDQAALNRLSPLTTFQLEGSSNLVDWELLAYVGLFPLVPLTFTDHADPGVAMRAFRLRY